MPERGKDTGIFHVRNGVHTDDAITLEDAETTTLDEYVSITKFDDGMAVGLGSSTFMINMQWYEEETTTASDLNTSDVLLVKDVTNNIVKQATIGGITALIDSTGGLSEEVFDEFMDDLDSYTTTITPDVEIVIRNGGIHTVSFENVLGGAFTHSDVHLDDGTLISDSDRLLFWNVSGTNFGLNRIKIEDLFDSFSSLTTTAVDSLFDDLSSQTVDESNDWLLVQDSSGGIGKVHPDNLGLGTGTGSGIDLGSVGEEHTSKLRPHVQYRLVIKTLGTCMVKQNRDQRRADKPHTGRR